MTTTFVKRWIVGEPMSLAQARHERLSKTIALAVFSSDALSSVAYATEEILLVLVLAAAAATHLTVPLSLAIVTLLAVVAISYQQTIHACPSGGGSYIVARANLGATPGLVAAALLIDHVLTAAVSVAAAPAPQSGGAPPQAQCRRRGRAVSSRRLSAGAGAGSHGRGSVCDLGPGGRREADEARGRQRRKAWSPSGDRRRRGSNEAW